MKQILTLLIAFSISAPYAQENPAAKEINEAIEAMDAGNFSQSRVILEEVLQKDSTNYDAWYEYAYSYYLQKDYNKALEIMQSQTKNAQATDQLWQMIGNSLDIIGKPEEALAAYAQGLERFPNSGRLYVESGNIFLIQNKIDEAIPYYEKGIEMAPEYPSNYYRLARIYCNSENEIWGVLYGEIFMNLERNTQRTREISALLYQTYQKALSYEKGQWLISFAKDASPFTIDFEMAIGLAAAAYGIDNKKPSINVASLTAIRKALLKTLSEQDKVKDMVLFTFWQQIDDMNFWDAYNYWVFAQAPNDQFEKWRKNNTSDFSYFVKWYNPNPIVITEATYFSKTKVLN
ncbi:MAG: tetratricopeptide repeat protein [Flavobacteriales bacterium]